MTYTARVCNNTPARQQMQVCARTSVTIDPIGADTIDQLLRQVPQTWSSVHVYRVSDANTCRLADSRQSSR